MKCLINILYFVLLVKSKDKFKPREFHIFCYNYSSLNIDNDDVKEEFLDRSREESPINYGNIEIVYTETKNSQISYEYDGLGNTLIRIQDKNGVCDVFGTILCTNLSPMFKYKFKDIKFVIGSNEDTEIYIKYTDFDSESILIIESDFFTDVFYKGDSIFCSKKNLVISYGCSNNTELVIRFSSIESIFSLSHTFGNMYISEEGSDEKLIKLKNGGTFDLKFNIDYSYTVYIKKYIPEESSWYNIFGYFY